MNISEHVGRFIQEMKRRGFSDLTTAMYVSNLKCFFLQIKKDHPKNINEQDIKDYLFSIKTSNTQRCHHSAIKKFYEICLGQKNKFKFIPYTTKSNKTPIILSITEIQKLFDVCTNEKHRAVMLMLYATGVRISELLSIKLKDIDRANMVIHILNGKGGKQRQVTMKQQLLTILEKYYKAYKPKAFLFEGNSGDQYSASSIRQFIKKYAELAALNKTVYPHLLRHNYATNSLEAGENLFITQKALGHSNPRTTSIYLHMSSKIIANAYSPITEITL